MSYNPVNDRRETYVAIIDAQVSCALTSNIRLLIELRCSDGTEERCSDQAYESKATPEYS